MKYVAERIENGTGERPLKGLLLESGIYYVDTKQEILDEQGISQGRVANLVVYAKDVKKWLVFTSDGSSYEEKDLPSGQDLSNYLTYDFTLKDKISYENATSNTSSSECGILHEFLGDGSTSAKHNHTFNESGVVYFSNFQTSQREKTINVGSNEVGVSDYKLPFNMVAKFTYNHDTGKIVMQCSYLRPELIDYVNPNQANTLIAENNDKILSPTDGIEKPIGDEDKSENGYGKEGNSTYFQPIQGLNQSLFLEKIDYSKIWAIHSKANSTFINLAVHEDIIAQIFNKDVTGINSFSLLLDPLNSNGKLGKYNQQAIEGEKISFNGDIIPSDEDANNPKKWINNDDEVTEEYTNIKNVTYSSGSFVNNGTTIAFRGDISCDIENGTSTIVQDSSSKYFVIPAKAGGGVFASLKLFIFYVARTQTLMQDYGIYFFEDNADAIGKFLEIIYQAAVENNEELEKQENDREVRLFEMAVKSQNVYGTKLVI